MQKIRVLIVSRHVFFRQALRTYLEGMGDIEMVAEVADCTEGLKLDANLKPCLLIVDVGSEGLDSLQESIRIKSHDPETMLVLYSLHEPQLYRTGKGKWADACLLQEELFDKLPGIIDSMSAR